MDRLRAMLEEVVTAAIERVVVSGDALVYFAEWIYTVDSSDGKTASLRATDARLPDLVDIPLWQGTGGALATPAVGSQVRVKFLNADRTKPIVSGLDTNTPTAVAIAGGGPAVGRVGDPVTLDGLGPGVLKGTVAGTVCTITATDINTAKLIIGAGSPRVTSG